jgi:DNA (cytosine-5)-methyltransferase 1
MGSGDTYVKVKQVGTKLDSNGGTQPYQQDRVYDADGIVPALNQGKSDLIVAMRGRYNEDGSTSQRLELNTSGKSNTLTAVQKDNMVIQVKSATSSGYEEATSGDSINLSNPNSETRRGRVGKQKAQTLETSCNQAVVQPNYDSKALNETIENSNLVEGEPQALDLYNRVARSESPTLTEPHHNSLRMFDGYRIRRLTPIECERLQGFPDDHTSFGNYDGEVKPMSNTQRYKQCGNAVTVDVVEAVAKKCIPLFKTNLK